MLLLHYALFAPVNGWHRGLVSVEMESMHLGEHDSIEDGGPEGSCTLNPPADNGALCSLSYGSETHESEQVREWESGSARRTRAHFLTGPLSHLPEMVGSAGNAPVRHFRLCFLTPDLQSGSRITSLKIGLPSRSSNAAQFVCVGPPSLSELWRDSLRPMLRLSEGW